MYSALAAGLAVSLPAAAYQVFVTNEKSGDVTIIDGRDFKVAATVPVGKRPRGIHLSPDGKIAYVALSGTPIEGPPQIDAHGNPVFDKKKAMMTRMPTRPRTGSGCWMSHPKAHA